MIRARIKSGLKKGLKKVLRVDISGPQPDYGLDPKHRSSTASPPVPVVAAPAVAAPAVAAPEPEPELPVEAAPVEAASVEAAPVEAAPVEAAPVEAAPTDDTAGALLSMEAVQEILDDMVRPALQGDGGDISLLKIEDANIYVRLVGSCSSCPSSIMTMKMGVEALLKEEFPMMKDLIQVD